VPELDPELVERAVDEATKRAANLDYFFDTLSSPEWIQPLRERGLFSEPPPQTITDDGYVLAPSWSASRYLARMAPVAPERVTSVIRTVETNNQRIHQDFIDAALAMPPEEAKEVAATEAAWLAEQEHIYYMPARGGVELATQLAKSGETEVATRLLHGLLGLSDEPRDDGLGLKRPKARFSEWEYDQALRQVVKDIVPVAPAQTLGKLVKLLGSALDLMQAEESEADTSNLRSRLWRPRVADDRFRGARIEDALVSALRDAARAIRAEALLSDSELVEVLTQRHEELFVRVAMDALAQEPESDIAEARKLAVDPEALTEGEPSVELRDLLTANAARLPRADVSVLVAAIHGGPDESRYRESRGPDLSDDELERYVAWWRAARLKLLLDALDEPERAEFERLVSIGGDAELPVSFEVKTFSGTTSPVTVDELGNLTDAALLNYLRTWEPESSWGEPSVEGLARTVAAFVQRHPERIGTLARGLRDVRPAFVQWTLEGLESALRDGKRFDWAPVIDLMSWIVDQPREIPGGRQDDYSDLDPGWVWTRRRVISLLEQGLGLEDDRGITADHREQVWHVVSTIAADPDPDPEHERRYGGSNMDPLTLALNTTRPRAIFAAVAYGRWLYSVLRLDDRANQGLEPALFREASELERLLEEHLDVGVEPSVAVRAAIAYVFPSLLMLDTAWAKAHAAEIFPDEDSPLREAAWGAYVVYVAPYDNVFPPLRVVYERSAELAGEPGHGFRWGTAPSSKLGEHLATYFWRGTLSLNEQLFQTFWRLASPEARRSVIDFLGRSARDFQKLGDEVEERLLSFWDFAHEAAVRLGSLNELAPFAWWFASEALPLDWRLEHLLRLLRDDVKPDPTFVVVEALSAVSEQEPLGAVQALRRLLELEQEPWAVYGFRSEIDLVLRRALDDDDPTTQQAAEDTAHWLGALGFREFRSLLTE
jgi:hypothetical protein